jgi:hypothetical protein
MSVQNTAKLWKVLSCYVSHRSGTVLDNALK